MTATSAADTVHVLLAWELYPNWESLDTEQRQRILDNLRRVVDKLGIHVGGLTDEQVEDVKQRTSRAAHELQNMAREHPSTSTEHARLNGKAAGILIALSYLRGYQ